MMKCSVQSLCNSCFLFLFSLLSVAAISAEYEELLKEPYPEDGPGAAAIVVRNGETVFVGATGMADLELGVELTENSVFQIASLTKQVTAAAIMILQDQGKISVNDDITLYLPDYPTQGGTITIEHLLTNTSGIPNYTRVPGYRENAIDRQDVDTRGLIELFKDSPLHFEPGDGYEYSNSGYVLLGAIIERVSGQSYYEFVERNILQELGMHNTYNGDSRKIIQNRVSGYTGEAGVFTNASFISMTQIHASGVLLSTVGDLAIWADGLMGGKLISDDALDAMTSNHPLNNGESSGYGYGLNIGKVFNHRKWSHGGALSGFLTHALWLPDYKVYVAVLQNQQTLYGVGPDYVAIRLALRAAGIANPLVENRSAVPNSDLAAYAGIYRIDGDDLKTTVSIVENRVFILDDGADTPWEMIPFTKDSFFFPGHFQTMVFVRDSSGKVTGMGIHAGGNKESVLAERIGDI